MVRSNSREYSIVAPVHQLKLVRLRRSMAMDFVLSIEMRSSDVICLSSSSTPSLCALPAGIMSSTVSFLTAWTRLHVSGTMKKE